MDVVAAVRELLFGNCEVRAGDHIVVAVSGGPDSAALAHILSQISGEKPLTLTIAHVDHGLRPDSGEDAAYVQALGELLNLSVHVRRVDVASLRQRSRLSVQMAARSLRLKALSDIAAQIGAVSIAFGHTRDDQAETLLLRLLQGTGPAGLAGIRPIRDRLYIHPLLNVPRSAIEEYLASHGIQPRRDPSNETLSYLRNRVRLRLIPLLEREFNPRLRESLAELAVMAQQDDEVLAGMADGVWRETVTETEVPRSIIIDTVRLSVQPAAVATRVLLRAAFQAGAGRIEAGHINAMLRQLRSGMPSAVGLPGGVLAQSYDDHITLEPPALMPTAPIPLAVPGTTELPAMGMTVSIRLHSRDELTGLPFPGQTDLTCWLDADQVSGLTMRFRRPGDRWQPLGMGGTKKLKKTLAEGRVPAGLRDRVPVMVSEGEIVWVVGHRIGHRYRVGEDTTRVMIVEVNRCRP